MEILLFVPQYVRWHYGRGTRELVRNCMDFLWFLAVFFSLGILFKTLFEPWERMNERYPEGIHVSDLIGVFIVNTLLRIVGFCIRVLVIIFGFISILVGIAISISALIFWVLLPVILVFLFALSLRYLFI